MNDLGVRGIRFNLSSGGGPSQTDEIRLLAERIAPLGWSVSFFMDADRITEMEPFLRSLPCDIILDHRAHIPAEQGIHHPAFPVLCRLLEEERIWIKLSALCIDSVKRLFRYRCGRKSTVQNKPGPVSLGKRLAASSSL